ncbi:MAG: T9SS type A sorting domain-containing protein [Candidatus Eisenbacteria bacterium]|nr:T9SS type A sorting domain-containing protein [Candidatus Eisenbacteria bacterium]
MKHRYCRMFTRGTHGPLFAAIVVATVLLAVLFQPALASPYVVFDPAETLVLPQEEFELSLRVTDCGDSIAGTELYLSFDSEKLELVEATEGTLYAQSGVMTWFGAEYDTASGCWHCYDTLIGAGSYIEGPGELMHFRFRALNECGSTTVHLQSIGFTDVHRDPLPPAGWDDAVVHVACSGAVGVPVAPVSLGPAAPNPFVHHTEIPFTVPRAGTAARVRICDVRGRVVRTLTCGRGTRDGTLRWDGTDHAGRAVSAGVYFVELEAGGEQARTRILRIR